MADTTMSRTAVAGLFQDESRAEKAVDELKAAGFAENDIGVATGADDTGKTNRFWEKVSRAFGKQEHEEHATELKDSLEDSGIPAGAGRVPGFQAGRRRHPRDGALPRQPASASSLHLGAQRS